MPTLIIITLSIVIITTIGINIGVPPNIFHVTPAGPKITILGIAGAVITVKDVGHIAGAVLNQSWSLKMKMKK